MQLDDLKERWPKVQAHLKHMLPHGATYAVRLSGCQLLRFEETSILVLQTRTLSHDRSLACEEVVILLAAALKLEGLSLRGLKILPPPASPQATEATTQQAAHPAFPLSARMIQDIVAILREQGW